jgi:hypothetical protein
VRFSSAASTEGEKEEIEIDDLVAHLLQKTTIAPLLNIRGNDVEAQRLFDALSLIQD